MPPLDNVFVARQPIFDRKRNIWGYEFFFRQCGDHACALITDERAADSSIIADGFSVGLKGLGEGKVICLNISLETLLDRAHLALPAKSVMLEVAAGEDPGRARHLCKEAKSQGYRITLEDYVGREEVEPLLQLADMVKINFADHEPRRIMALRNQLKDFKGSLIAAKVEDWQAFEGAKALGFHFYQGYFFSLPEIAPGRKISGEQASLLRLLRVLADSETDIEQVLSVIASEPPLVYRLLRYINSPAFGLSCEGSSMQRAVHLLGMQRPRCWAKVACISDMDSSDKGSELSWCALHRAQFLKLLAENNLAHGWEPESMFLLGLFSNIDAVLGVPMEGILGELPLAGDIKSALLGLNDMSGWLALLKDLEMARGDEVQRSIEQMGVPAFKASKLYLHATRLAAEAMQAGNAC